MAFDWRDFLDQYHVPYVTSGHSVARGNVAVRCPWCGPEDPSTHMGISLDGKGWGCWRRSDHRGRQPARLVAALLNCSMERAYQIVGISSNIIGEDFLAQVNNTLAPPGEPERAGKLAMPDEFRLLAGRPSARPYNNYLRKRGFADPASLARDFDLRYCTRGPYHGRIIFPIRFQGELMSWSGRSIYPTEPMRYKVLSSKPERAEKEGLGLARGPNSHYLLFYDELVKAKARALYICEGPFDALKIMVLGRPHGVVATCLFTNAPTIEQVDLLYDLAPRFAERYLLLDRDMFYMAVRVSSELSGLDLKPVMLPPGVKDPGELTDGLFQQLVFGSARG